jgi:DNA-directed RNA polymerase subunit K/omega
MGPFYRSLLPWRNQLLEYTRFEKARIVGARSLQVSMGAPILIEVADDMMNPVEIALLEFDAGVIPITVRRAITPKQE